MLTDWVLIRRLARELDETLSGARLEDAGLLVDGRIGLVLRKHRIRLLAAVDPFASPPMVTLENEDLGVNAEPGFVRALARSLQGMTLSRIAARRHDRLLRLTFSARSRFGVGEQLDLYLELVPRFGNLVLVKGDRIVAALKEFDPSTNARRAIRAGDPYLLPPLPAQVRTLSATPVDDDVLVSPLHVYRRDGRLLQAYVAPLDGFDDAQHSREGSLLRLFDELRAEQNMDAGRQRSDRRRHAMLKRLEERERRLRGELDALAEKHRRAEQRQALRVEGERIFATLHETDEAQREEAKDQATKLFAAYKKLAKGVPHIDARERAVAGFLQAVEVLRWEAERAADEDLGEVESAVAELIPRSRTTARQTSPKRKRAPLELRTELGSRIIVGRSPVENAELTFRVARPNDLWFHAQGIPGAHVVLTRDDRSTAPDADLQLAASLAAYYSRARAATSVPVDYTLRKHVRKQRAAPPGLVWYTHANTIVTQPKSLDTVAASDAS
jgi:predicted ribosome quality control (RQC) complex YloA/Tae2 family protein